MSGTPAAVVKARPIGPYRPVAKVLPTLPGRDYREGVVAGRDFARYSLKTSRFLENTALAM